MRIRPFVRTLRAGDPRARLSALSKGQQMLTVSVSGGALRTGVLDALEAGPMATPELARRLGWTDLDVAEAFLRTLAAYRLVADREGQWQLTRRARRVLADDVVRAAFEAFGGYHAELYRDLGRQLTGGERRRDIEDDGRLVARLSRFMDEFVLAELDRVVSLRQPTRVLDVGCGAAAHLVHVLRAVPDATWLGVETDSEAASLAREAVASAGLEGRGEVVEGDAHQQLADHPEDRFDLVLLANVIYYVPLEARVGFLRTLAERLDPGGRVLVVTTALTDEPFSRHFDLLLRTHAGGRQLPDMEVLADQMRRAGLEPDSPRRIAPGEPVTALLAHRRP
jgi:SAM-dependent methyltransferase